MDNNNGPSERKRRSDRHEKEEKRTFFMIVRDFFTTTGKETIDDAIDETKIYRPSRKFQTYEKRSEEHTSELQSRDHLVCRLLLEKKKNLHHTYHNKIIS